MLVCFNLPTARRLEIETEQRRLGHQSLSSIVLAIHEPLDFSTLKFQTKCRGKLLAFALLEEILNKLIISVRCRILLVDLRLVIANAIKVKVNIVIVLLKSFLFELVNLKIHVNFVMRLNAIENNCKNCETIHLLFFSIRSSPSVRPLKLFNSLASCWR
jgi:hypothetical protein